MASQRRHTVLSIIVGASVACQNCFGEQFSCHFQENITDVEPNGGALYSGNCNNNGLSSKLMVIVGQDSVYHCATSLSEQYPYNGLLASQNCDIDAILLADMVGDGVNMTCSGGGTGGGGMSGSGNGPIIVLANCNDEVSRVNSLISKYDQRIFVERVVAIVSVVAILGIIIAVVFLAKYCERRKRYRLADVHVGDGRDRHDSLLGPTEATRLIIA